MTPTTWLTSSNPQFQDKGPGTLVAANPNWATTHDDNEVSDDIALYGEENGRSKNRFTKFVSGMRRKMHTQPDDALAVTSPDMDVFSTFKGAEDDDVQTFDPATSGNVVVKLDVRPKQSTRRAPQRVSPSHVVIHRIDRGARFNSAIASGCTATTRRVATSNKMRKGTLAGQLRLFQMQHLSTHPPSRRASREQPLKPRTFEYFVVV